jgi:intracellular sulfur oxidation DsrE/DsrF family protein
MDWSLVMLRYFSLILLALCCAAALADTESDLTFLLNAKNPPIGVVFEIVEGDDEALDWAIPKTQGYIKRLKTKYPSMKFAVVSHGSEQFGLLKENEESMQETHKKVKSLVAEDVPLHVCGTHASWRDKLPDDFPDYVQVATSGPAQIRNYQRQGYALIVVE